MRSARLRSTLSQSRVASSLSKWPQDEEAKFEVASAFSCSFVAETLRNGPGIREVALGDEISISIATFFSPCNEINDNTLLHFTYVVHFAVYRIRLTHYEEMVIANRFRVLYTRACGIGPKSRDKSSYRVIQTHLDLFAQRKR